MFYIYLYLLKQHLKDYFELQNIRENLLEHEMQLFLKQNKIYLKISFHFYYFENVL